jgi:hypothetical protein
MIKVYRARGSDAAPGKGRVWTLVSNLAPLCPTSLMTRSMHSNRHFDHKVGASFHIIYVCCPAQIMQWCGRRPTPAGGLAAQLAALQKRRCIDSHIS